MPYAFRFAETGAPDVLRWQEFDPGKPGRGQVLIRNTAVGLNYIDVYVRTGLYPAPLPSGIGFEAAGVIEAVGPGVRSFRIGDRVAHEGGPLGAYAEFQIMPVDQLVKLPKEIKDQQAAAMMLKGMTAEYLIRRTYKVKRGETVLFHAAAGGVGLIACQWLKHLGATVIGTVGSKEKAELARKNGCDHPILYREENFVERVKEITGGKGVPVVYDGVGKTVFMDSLDCLKPRGMMVTYGNASGAVDPIPPLLLSRKGSLYLTRPTLGHYTSTGRERAASAKALFDVVLDGAVKITVSQTYQLRDAVRAHRDLEARRTTGSTVLLP
jgi:NADPH2:quinone reductase